MVFNPGKAFEVAQDGLGFLVDGEQKSLVVAGDGTPIGQQAPTSALYLQNDTGDFWQKVGPDTDDSETGWQRNGQSFANATDFESFFDDALESTTSDGWVTKLEETTGPKASGRYYVGWSLEAGQSDKEKNIGTRVQIDTGSGWIDLMDIQNGVSVDDQFELRSGFRILDDAPAAVGGYDLRVQFGQTYMGGVWHIQNVAIIIYRIGDATP